MKENDRRPRRRLLDWLLGRGFRPLPSPADQCRAAMDEGNRHLSEGDIATALACYRNAVILDPNHADAQVNLGYALMESGMPVPAGQAFRSALKHVPHHADAHFFLGRIAVAFGNDAEAAEHMEAALQIAPQLEAAYAELAAILFRLGRSERALIVLTQGIKRMPQRADLHFLKGNVLAEATMHREAVEAYTQALELQPDFAEAMANKGNCERHLGLVDEALKDIETALKYQPNNAAWHSNRLFTLQYGGMLGPEALFQEHLKFAERFETPLLDTSRDDHPMVVQRSARLRLGYVSGDLRQHSLAYFFEPVLRQHDRSRVEVFCYYTYPVIDDVTRRMREEAEHWRDCAQLSDEAMAQCIRNDGIDVLVDLSGHTGHHRLLVFARRPAPIQVTWLGYQATTGLANMDYRITDAGVDPPGETERFHSEQLLRLSSGAIFQPDPQSPPVAALPCIASGTFTFGCLNNPAKITSSFVAAAAAILHAVPNSRLLLGNAGVEDAPEWMRRFGEHGVPAHRLVLRAKTSMPNYLAMHAEIDLALDTFPYNGGTTTMHSLWMGVPVLSLEGKTAISRVGVQTMRGLGLEEFACATMDEYVARAIEIANSTDFLRKTRAGLRQRLERVMVDQARAFTVELEDAFLSLHSHKTSNSGEK
ncbi:tetratricopeptide repeat protein [Xylophilus rhododendri]|uniref:protein O-GlcNAc transferase n=1 Tax=Xylophilus rhododendri TaxID=2697032 RepID=A0A857J886_9BURK|nr:glycosyltransferase family 41 protein [Xylophilus rhododendri]QHI98995.1 tetratricopeptide repeat protein [Xylophilus rhododendri]